MKRIALLTLAAAAVAVNIAVPAGADPAGPAVASAGSGTCIVDGETITFEGISPANGRPIHDTTGTNVLIIHGYTSTVPGFERPLTPGIALEELTTCTGTITTAAGTIDVTVYGILTPRSRP